MTRQSDITIEIKPHGGSYTDYTANVIWASASFTSSMSAVPGEFSLDIRDQDRTLSFTTGSEIRVTIDSVVMFGGYVTQVSMIHLAPAADTSNLSTYQLRAWRLRGTDYNIILDRRYIRDTSNYTAAPIIVNETQDGAILTALITNYTDCSDFSTSGIDHSATIPDITAYYSSPGNKLRDEFENVAKFGIAVYYVNAEKTFIYVPYESTLKSWGFSDQPDGVTTIGFANVEATEDGSYIENDVMIWGGAPLGSLGSVVFDREQDATSIADHGRWQYAEAHPGEREFATQDQVTARAQALLEGPPGTAPDPIGGTNITRGLKFPQYEYAFTWTADRVPLSGGVPDHLIAGDIVQIDLAVFGTSIKLPLRQLRITFPAVPDSTPDAPKTFVQFEGTFGLQLSDPYGLWHYLIGRRGSVVSPLRDIVTLDSTSTNSTYGGYWQGVPTFVSGSTYKTQFAYITGTLLVYIDRKLAVRGTDWAELDPEAGTFTVTAAGTVTYATARTLEA